MRWFCWGGIVFKENDGGRLRCWKWSFDWFCEFNRFIWMTSVESDPKMNFENTLLTTFSGNLVTRLSREIIVAIVEWNYRLVENHSSWLYNRTLSVYKLYLRMSRIFFWYFKKSDHVSLDNSIYFDACVCYIWNQRSRIDIMIIIFFHVYFFFHKYSIQDFIFIKRFLFIVHRGHFVLCRISI